jgi:nicotinate phosphoribosyltransferase
MEVQFDHFYRRYPDYDQHQAGYCVNAGLAWLLDWMRAGPLPRRRPRLPAQPSQRAGRTALRRRFSDYLRITATSPG